MSYKQVSHLKTGFWARFLLAVIFIIDLFMILANTISAHQKPVQSVQIGSGTGNHGIGIGGFSSGNIAIFFHAHAHSGLRIGAFGHRVYLI